MAGKRVAGNYLTDRNWDQEEEPEEAGTFQKAGCDDLQKRKIKVAKRRIPQEEENKSEVFKGFSFGAGALGSGSTPKISLGGFGTFANKDNSSESSGFPKITFGTKSEENPSNDSKSSSNGASSMHTTKPTETSTGSRSQYLADLKGLNEGFRKWICQHLDKNALVDLTPVCTDYVRHMERLEKHKSDKQPASGTENNNPFLAKAKPASEPDSKGVDEEVSFKTSKVDAAEESSVSADKVTTSSMFGQNNDKDKFSSSMFGQKNDTEKVTTTMFGQKNDKDNATPSFTFGQKNEKAEQKPAFGFAQSMAAPDSNSKPAEQKSEATAKAPFSFTFAQKSDNDSAAKASLFGSAADSTAKSSFVFGAQPTSSFSFGTAAAGPSSGATAEPEEEYVPPVLEHKAVEEEGSLYMQRCKLFYQKEGKWTEKGLGNLHLKEAGEKTQLVVRADTSLGNILLNIMLQPSMQFKSQGKKDVSFLCVPNPPLDAKASADEKAKPAMMLVRVKSEDIANEMRAKLSELAK